MSEALEQLDKAEKNVVSLVSYAAETARLLSTQASTPDVEEELQRLSGAFLATLESVNTELVSMIGKVAEDKAKKAAAQG